MPSTYFVEIVEGKGKRCETWEKKKNLKNDIYFISFFFLHLLNIRYSELDKQNLQVAAHMYIQSI